MSTTDNAMTKIRDGKWSSGYRECIADSTAWGNTGIEFPSTSSWTVSVTSYSCTLAELSWPEPPTYSNISRYDVTCTPSGGSTITGSTAGLTYTLNDLPLDTTISCDVTAYPYTPNKYSDSVNFKTPPASACGPVDTNIVTYDSTITVTVTGTCDQATLDAIEAAVCEQQTAFLVSQGFAQGQVTCTATASCGGSRRRRNLLATDASVGVTLSVDIGGSEDLQKHKDTKTAVLAKLADASAHKSLPSGVTMNSISNVASSEESALVVTESQVSGKPYQRQISWTAQKAKLSVGDLAVTSYTVKCTSTGDSNAERTHAVSDVSSSNIAIVVGNGSTTAALKYKKTYRCGVAANNDAASGTFVYASGTFKTPPNYRSATATIDTVVNKFDWNNGPAVDAILKTPTRMAMNGSTLYYTDNGSHYVRKIDMNTGIITTVAGTGIAGYDASESTGTLLAVNATLNGPHGLAVMGSALLIADKFNERIRRVDMTTGIITTAVGTGVAGYNPSDTVATSAMISYPHGIAVKNSDFWFCDYNNNRVRKVTSDGTISLVAGNGTTAYSASQENILAVNAALNGPVDLAFDGDDLYVASRDADRVFKINSAGYITTGVGGGATFSDGVAPTATSLNVPVGIAISGGVILIGEKNSHRVRKVSNGVITTLAGTGVAGAYRSIDEGAVATSVKLNEPVGVAFHGSDYIVTDSANSRIRKISSGGLITSIAGSGASNGFSGDNGPGLSARLNAPNGLALQGTDLLIADVSNNRIRKLNTLTGQITTFAGNGSTGLSTETFNAPQHVVANGSTIYVADRYNNAIRSIGSTGYITTIVHATVPNTATLSSPFGLAIKGDDLFIADYSGRRVRRYNAVTKAVTTVAGTGSSGNTGDNGSATAATLTAPISVAVHRDNLYILDFQSHALRKVDLTTNIITRVAGVYGSSGSGGDGGAATAAQLSNPFGLAVDDYGNILIGDTFNHRIRFIDVDSKNIYTLGGSVAGDCQDAGVFAEETTCFDSPRQLVLDSDYNLYISDNGMHRIRKVEF